MSISTNKLSKTIYIITICFSRFFLQKILLLLLQWGVDLNYILVENSFTNSNVHHTLFYSHSESLFKRLTNFSSEYLIVMHHFIFRDM